MTAGPPGRRPDHDGRHLRRADVLAEQLQDLGFIRVDDEQAEQQETAQQQPDDGENEEDRLVGLLDHLSADNQLPDEECGAGP